MTITVCLTQLLQWKVVEAGALHLLIFGKRRGEQGSWRLNVSLAKIMCKSNSMIEIRTLLAKSVYVLPKYSYINRKIR